MSPSVIVAGAGPAGAVAARTLAAAGVRVLLVDKASFPRNKPCGGGIGVRTLRRFPWLEAAMRGIDIHPLATIELQSPNGASFTMAQDAASMWLIRRVEFDHALVREAVRAGAVLRERFEITQASADRDGVTLTSRAGETLRAPIVIAADGVHSVLAKRLGIHASWPASSVALDMMEETPHETLRASRPDVMWVSYGYRGFDGYAYIFPKVRHTNVGVGCLLSDFKARVDEHPYDVQSQYVDALIAAGELQGRSDRAHFTPFLIPVGGPLRRAYDATGRVLFAGDAGGFVNAFTAEGIYYAMISGDLAARAAVAANGSSRGGRQFDRLWRRELGAELRDASLIQRLLFADHERVNGVVRAGRHLPWLGDVILDYAAGRLTYLQARRRILSAFPRTAVRLAAIYLQRRFRAAPPARELR